MLRIMAEISPVKLTAQLLEVIAILYTYVVYNGATLKENLKFCNVIHELWKYEISTELI